MRWTTNNPVIRAAVRSEWRHEHRPQELQLSVGFRGTTRPKQTGVGGTAHVPAKRRLYHDRSSMSEIVFNTYHHQCFEPGSGHGTPPETLHCEHRHKFGSSNVWFLERSILLQKRHELVLCLLHLQANHEARRRGRRVHRLATLCLLLLQLIATTALVAPFGFRGRSPRRMPRDSCAYMLVFLRQRRK